MEVVATAKAMGVPAPILLSSPQCRTPFVFGRTSRQARLAIPDTWNRIGAGGRTIMLCHELAHIRNHDVGFLTWSFAFLCDLKWALLLCPAAMLLSLWGGQEHLPQATVLYAVCLLILWCLTHSVVRSRELLADAMVAMLIDAGKIVQTLAAIVEAPETGLCLGVRRFSGTVSRVRSWLADKAMFAERPLFWKVLAQLVEWSVETHPSVSVRQQAIDRGHIAGVDSSVGNRQAFWAGLTLGLLGVLIALGGFWAGKCALRWDDDEKIVLLSYRCWGSAAPLAVTWVALFFVLPAWSSLHPHVPTGPNMARLLVRYLYGLLGACSVLPLLFLGGWSHLEVKLLFVLLILWVLLILAMGIETNIVMLSLWLSLRYRRRFFFTDLAWTLYSCGMGVIAIFCYFAWGLVLMSNGRTLAGGSLVFGLLIGLAAFLAVSKESVVCGIDQYTVIVSPRPIVALEGRRYRRWAPLVGSLHMIGTCLGPTAVVSAAIYKVGNRVLGYIEDPTAEIILLLLLLGCSILLFFDRRWPRRMRQTCRQKICALVGCQILLQEALSVESRGVIDKALEILRPQHNKWGDFGVMTTQKMFELTMLAPLSVRAGHWIGERTHQWALACETDMGFGVWPGSGPRLSATYQCLQILQDTGGIQLSDPNQHVTWIRSLQTRDGSFRGPWSYRSRAEDTFFATMSLNLLGYSLEEPEREHCLTWLKETLVGTGIERGQLDASHHCLAAIEALHGLDEEILKAVGPGLSAELDRLLLTNVGHNAENIRHAVCAYHILGQRGFSLAHPERITLLADRINDALEAELAALRI